MLQLNTLQGNQHRHTTDAYAVNSDPVRMQAGVKQ